MSRTDCTASGATAPSAEFTTSQGLGAGISVDLSRQHQTIFGDRKGNCFSACIACMLRVPIAEVPNFCGDHLEEDGTWMRECIRWLAPHGYSAIYLKTGDWLDELPGLVVIAGGKNPGGEGHCVLMSDGELLHDPHPGGTGLVEIEDATLLVPLDGARELDRLRDQLEASREEVRRLMAAQGVRP